MTRPNQVWAMDITYVLMARGFVYLTAVVDWFSPKVLTWRLSVTLETGPCLEALDEAGIRISMDGKGAWRDECLRRAALAQRQIQGGLPARR